jgi:HAD superfamily hydrolase (TIGR01459 family)
MPRMIETLDGLANGYDAVFCDVWGVLHNGMGAFPDAVRALVRLRESGKCVVLLTNAPRPHATIEEQLRALGVPAQAWDRVVTSGDVTRDLIREAPRLVYHLGPDRDLVIYDGLDIELVESQEARAISCTGLFDDDTEGPEDYADLLRRLRARDLPMICANPDIVVDRAGRLIWCAGALARDYARLGGRTLIAGKPHRPIYEAALQEAMEVLGRDLDARAVLAIGDGILTDVKGAVDNGFDLLYVTSGIHALEYGEGERPAPARLAAFLDNHGYEPVAAMTRLK